MVVGLGNVGREYEETRHNVGFLVVDRFALRQGWSFKQAPFQASLCRGLLGQDEICLIKPLTLMNRSGEAVRSAVNYYKLKPTSENLLIISDDIDLPFGQIRIRARGGHGGHNGIASVIESLGIEEFARIRIGIGRPSTKEEVTHYVLSPFSKEQKKGLDSVLADALSALELWIAGKLDSAMQKFNSREIATG
ncbi:MAG: aminoacyl-tRNA hydrolase [Deltaproteobacteria bacterium]|nr:aminoacyl-tRNA hydrolase [Deltaproteobacteria bacterium]